MESASVRCCELFIGVALALGYFGVSRYVSVPVAARAAPSHDREWQLSPPGAHMYVLVALSLAVIPLAVLSYRGSPGRATGLVAGVEGGLPSGTLLLIIALAGTTVAPWQLVCQQSNVVDKRITPRWLAYKRGDTLSARSRCSSVPWRSCSRAPGRLQARRCMAPSAMPAPSRRA